MLRPAGSDGSAFLLQERLLCFCLFLVSVSQSSSSSTPALFLFVFGCVSQSSSYFLYAKGQGVALIWFC